MAIGAFPAGDLGSENTGRQRQRRLVKQLLYVYPDSAGHDLKAIYFDNEGHTIQYAVTTPRRQTAVFLSDPSQPGPQFRMSYELRDKIMYGKFEIKAPGQSGFKPYLEWSGARK